MTWFNSWNPMNVPSRCVRCMNLLYFYFIIEHQFNHITYTICTSRLERWLFSSVTATILLIEHVKLHYNRRKSYKNRQNRVRWINVCVCLVCIIRNMGCVQMVIEPSSTSSCARMVAGIFNTSFGHSLRYYFSLIRFFFGYYTLQVFLLFRVFLHRSLVAVYSIHIYEYIRMETMLNSTRNS